MVIWNYFMSTVFQEWTVWIVIFPFAGAVASASADVTKVKSTEWFWCYRIVLESSSKVWVSVSYCKLFNFYCPRWTYYTTKFYALKMNACWLYSNLMHMTSSKLKNPCHDHDPCYPTISYGAGNEQQKAVLDGCYNTVHNTTVQKSMESSNQWYALR